jgi:hypothetical protein
MTPQDVPGPIITTASLSPWLCALATATEPARPSRPRPAPEAEPLRPAA